jgi:hypothetical protein
VENDYFTLPSKLEMMCAQLDLEVRCKRTKIKRRASNFHSFWSKEVHGKKNLKNKTLMFECYNLLDPME